MTESIAVDTTPSGESDSAVDASSAMIEARELSKFYKDFAATTKVNFRVPKNQVCAFLGPNGAGKSTTMKMLTGYLAPSEGQAFLAGNGCFGAALRSQQEARLLARKWTFVH